MFTPIGPGQAALQIGLQQGQVPSGLIPSAEKKLTTEGQLIQATGLNVRAQLGSMWDADFEEYLDIPSNINEVKAKAREAGMYPMTRELYRQRNPEVDAKLFIVGQVSSLASLRARQAALKLMQENNLKITDIKGLEEQEYESKDRTALRLWFQRRLVGQAAPPSGLGQPPAYQMIPSAPISQRFMPTVEPTPAGVR